MLNEWDVVVLTHDLEKYGLKKGDMGTVVHVYSESSTLEVEFVTADGKTVGVLTLNNKDVRSTAKNEILHARYLTT